MAVYNDGVLYDVVISDKTAETIAPAAQTEELVLESTKTLPADVSKITAKLFVWDSPVSLRPLMKNIDLQ